MLIRNILRNAGLVSGVYLYASVRGRAVRAPRTLNRILVVQTAKMGDMVCATPVLHAIKEQFPYIHITVLGDVVGKKVLADSPDAHEYLVSSDGFFSLLHAMRRNRVDASIVLVPDARAIALSYLAGIPLVVAPEVVNGYCPWMTKTYRALLRLVKAVPHRMGHYAPGEYLQMLEPFGVRADDTTKHLSYSDEARER